LLFST